MELKTPFYDCHVNLKGKIVPFAGYLLPIQYETGVIKEHMAVRKNAGLFDVSHMGEFVLKGKDAYANIQRLVTNDLSKMVMGQVKYSPICNEFGGVVDDVLVYKFCEDEYFIVVNAANRHKDHDFMKKHISGEVTFSDLSDGYAQVALQGPKSLDILNKLVVEKEGIPSRKYTFQKEVLVGDIPCMISRTGYTGEDGFEIYCHKDNGVKLFQLLLEQGKEYGLIPCGLGARDTLRLEAGMPLYGHEINDEITPIEAGLGVFVKLNKGYFIGKEALIHHCSNKVRIGIKVIGRGIGREGYEIYRKDMKIGSVTSGTHSPYFHYPIAMAYVEKEYSEIGTKLDMVVRDKRIEVTVVALPFYKKQK